MRALNKELVEKNVNLDDLCRLQDRYFTEVTSEIEKLRNNEKQIEDDKVALTRQVDSLKAEIARITLTVSKHIQ